jgi:L-glyceraldehyde 3-phosphate reductase
MHAALLKLNELAAQRGQSLAQMALAWCLKDQKVCSVIIGASRVEQIADNLKAIENTSFSPEELDAITACVL